MQHFMQLRKIAISFAIFAVVTIGSAVTTRADMATINVPNSGLSGTPGPYATVVYVLNGSSIDVTVTRLDSFTMFGTQGGFSSGNNGIFGFNVVGDTGGLTVTNLVNITDVSLTGGNMDGFGNFEVTLSCGCNPPGVTSFSFTVSRSVGFSAASQLFEANSTGAHFATHISPGPNIPTGFAADSGTPSEVPEPASMFLLGTGLAGIGAGLRRRHKRRDPSLRLPADS